mgnify:CR=1 FL=1
MKIPSEWTFKSSEVANGFDRHVREQLPWYDLMSGAVAHIARHYIPEGGLIYDLGSSTGNTFDLISDQLKTRSAKYIGVDNSSQMVSSAQIKYQNDDEAEFVCGDMGRMEVESFDVAICFLSLMFLSVRERTLLIEKLLREVRIGGAIIIVDKIGAPSGYVGTIMRRLTLAGKVASGVSADEIMQKELSLIGVQRPMSKHELPTCALKVFQFGEFSGYVIDQQRLNYSRRVE